MRIYLTGADGMLGTALRAALAADPLTAGWDVRGVSVADFDIGDPGAVRASVEDFAPDVVVHTAAHAIVDECEADPQLALRVNVGGGAPPAAPPPRGPAPRRGGGAGNRLGGGG
ncbi:sugar nucleotide-binding protein, partial [Nonomuraea sp. NPDC059022]|uniref:sugar nucleotide-binding protein n=1 Tax=Nonomuraea sp. NPDC059022 TaxID=3346705 RepID=UPI00369DA7E3